MSDKPVAGLVAAALVAPLVAVCCLAPAALVSGAGWLFGWLGGGGTGMQLLLAAGSFVAAMLVLRRWRGRGAKRAHDGGAND